jgi:ribosomal protein S18 acetylase RimI-like enzyme
MELARSGKLVIRRATRGDAGLISTLFRSAIYEHKHADWSYPSDWLGEPGFYVCERERIGSGNEIVACLAAAADPPPAAWIRLAAAKNSTSIEAIFVEMIQAIRMELQSEGIAELGWLAANRWPDSWYANMGFELANWIITYVKLGLPATSATAGEIKVRAATLADLESCAAVEEAAFDGLWRHSAASLRSAFTQAVCFDVAYLESQLVGFHYSVRGIDDDTAHLVRITVHPDIQRRGVGSALMVAAFDAYRQKGISNVTLNTQQDNLASHRLYEKFGFRQLGERIPLWVMKITEPAD